MSAVKRIRIEAIDFDWIFIGDNTANMINLLANHADTKLLVQKSVRVFISLIWDEYHPKIVRRIFIPYLIYLCIFLRLTSFYSIQILDEIDNHEEH